MNRDALLSLYKFNQFANELLFTVLEKADDSIFSAESPSRDSITGMLRHMLSVESAYLANLSGQAFDRNAVPDQPAALIAGIRAKSDDYLAYLDGLQDSALAEMREWFGITLPVHQLLTQNALHTLQHRTEMSLILSQNGIETTDMDILKYFIVSSGQEWPW